MRLQVGGASSFQGPPTLMALTAKQQAFVAEYLVDFNGAAAAVRAGYSEKTAKSIASELLQKPEIASAVDAAKADRVERVHVSQDDVVRELAAVAFARLSDFVSWDDGEITLVSSDQIEAEKMPALRELVATVETFDGETGSRTTRRMQVRQHDKIRALELLGRHTGLWKEGGLPEGEIQVTVVWPEQAEASAG